MAKPPALAITPAAPLRLAATQLLLLRDGEEMVEVTSKHQAARRLLAKGEAEVSFDACVQAALPWRPPLVGWEAATLANVQVVHELAAPMQRLRNAVRRLTPEVATDADVQHVRSEWAVLLGAMRTRGDGALTQAAQHFDDALGPALDNAAAVLSRPQQKAETLAARRECLLPLQRAVEALRPARLAADALRECGGVGVRRYAPDQPLLLRRSSGEWAEVGAADLDEVLHPWNHAPRELAVSQFEELRRWWLHLLRAQHSHIVDALSGEPRAP